MTSAKSGHTLTHTHTHTHTHAHCRHTRTPYSIQGERSGGRSHIYIIHRNCSERGKHIPFPPPPTYKHTHNTITAPHTHARALHTNTRTTHAHIRTRTYTHPHTCVCTYVPTLEQINTHIHIPKYPHLYIHTHVHTGKATMTCIQFSLPLREGKELNERRKAGDYFTDAYRHTPRDYNETQKQTYAHTQELQLWHAYTSLLLSQREAL